MPNQALIPPQSLTEKMNAGYPKRTTGGSGGTVITTATTTDTTIVIEQTKARIITDQNITLSGLQELDGVLLGIRDIVVVNGQTDRTENGIYLADDAGWTRHSQEVYGGLMIAVTEGDKYADTLWEVSSPEDTVEFGVTEIIFSEFRNVSLRNELRKEFNSPTEIADLIEDDVDSALCLAVNNNTSCRYNVPESTTTLATGWTVVPFSNKNFEGGGINVRRDGLYDWRATANKCGVYSVYAELEFTNISALTIADPQLAIFVTRAKYPALGAQQWYYSFEDGLGFHNNLSRLWGNIGGSFVLNGSDLVYLDCGDFIDIRLYNGNLAAIVSSEYNWNGYVAISYQGNRVND